MEKPPPSIPSHYIPRTYAGRAAVILFLGLLALAEPPIVFAVANRIEPWIGGVPFLYGWLTLVYVALLAVLILVWRRGV